MPPPTTESGQAIELPDPERLEEARQQHIRRRWLWYVGVFFLLIVLYINLFAGTLGALVLGFGVVGVFGISGTVVLLPVIGMFALARWYRASLARAVKDVRAVMGVEVGVPWGSIVAVSLLLAMGIVGYGLSTLNVRYGLGVGLGLFAIFGPLLRKRLHPALTPSGMFVMFAWLSVAPVLGVALFPVLGGQWAFGAGVLWTMLGPYGPLVQLIRQRVIEHAVGEGPFAGLARFMVGFLSNPDVAEVHRLSGDPAAGRDLLVKRLHHPMPRPFFVRAMIELVECLEALEDPRTEPVLAAVCMADPADPRPFAALASAVKSRDPERALAYVRFAEENAARKLKGGDPEVSALREAIEEYVAR